MASIEIRDGVEMKNIDRKVNLKVHIASFFSIL
jgi:hypothetical protein